MGRKHPRAYVGSRASGSAASEGPSADTVQDSLLASSGTGATHLMPRSCPSYPGTSERKGWTPLCLGWVPNVLLNAQTTGKAHWSLHDGLKLMGRRKPHGASP